jgi:outer membrane protein OmpA-like peptidoglycan-associated protein
MRDVHTSFNSLEDGSGLFYAGNLDARFRTGWVALGSVGWGFGNGLRLEGEASYRSNDVERLATSYPGQSFGGVLTSITGRAETFALMANALYDFQVSPWFSPYIGAGIGMGWHRWGGLAGTEGGDTRIRVNDTVASFAYQGIAGIAVPIRAVPGLAITAEYRYFAMLNTHQNGRYVYTPVQGAPATGSQNASDVNNQNHSLLLGVRYNFGHAPRAVAVAQQPAAARSFIVFFDFDRADLTARGREIVGQAAQAARTGTTRIEVAGHADRSGSDAYNQALSQRRANTVAAELVRIGVARNAISVAAFGESRPLVPTADGVREPQNRRVEIVLR